MPVNERYGYTDIELAVRVRKVCSSNSDKRVVAAVLLRSISLTIASVGPTIVILRCRKVSIPCPSLLYFVIDQKVIIVLKLRVYAP